MLADPFPVVRSVSACGAHLPGSALGRARSCCFHFSRGLRLSITYRRRMLTCRMHNVTNNVAIACRALQAIVYAIFWASFEFWFHLRGTDNWNCSGSETRKENHTSDRSTIDRTEQIEREIFVNCVNFVSRCVPKEFRDRLCALRIHSCCSSISLQLASSRPNARERIDAKKCVNSTFKSFSHFLFIFSLSLSPPSAGVE